MLKLLHSSVDISSFLYEPLHITFSSFPTRSVFSAETPLCPLRLHPQENSLRFSQILCYDTTSSSATRSLFFMSPDLLEWSTNMHGQHTFNSNKVPSYTFPSAPHTFYGMSVSHEHRTFFLVSVGWVTRKSKVCKMNPLILQIKEVKAERHLNLLQAPVNWWCLGTAQSTNHTTLCTQAAGFHFIISFSRKGPCPPLTVPGFLGSSEVPLWREGCGSCCVVKTHWATCVLDKWWWPEWMNDTSTEVELSPVPRQDHICRISSLDPFIQLHFPFTNIVACQVFSNTCHAGELRYRLPWRSGIKPTHPRTLLMQEAVVLIVSGSILQCRVWAECVKGSIGTKLSNYL